MHTVILPLICVACVAFFKAVSDTLVHHFDTSVFKWLNRRFWDPAVSSAVAPFLRFTRYKIDAWHISNSCMIVALCAAVALHRPVLAWWWEVGILGLWFNLVFNVFYDRLLRRK